MNSISSWLEAVRLNKAGAHRLALSLLLFVFFGFLNFSFSQLPISTGAPYLGQKLAGFTLPDQSGKSVSLAELLKPQGAVKSGGLVLIFYRGYW